MSPAMIPPADLESFSSHLRSSTRILALLGAGLSAASGLPTFRGADGLWRTHDAISLATPEAFEKNPGLVWQFYSYRRHMAFEASPNPAHYALAELARRNESFITLTQNVDGLSPRAGHPASQLHLLHGSLSNVKCTSFSCNHVEENFTDPIVPALAVPQEGAQPHPSSEDKIGVEAVSALDNSMNQANDRNGTPPDPGTSDDWEDIPEIPMGDLPHCSKCGEGLLRPGVVWFGESLPEKTLAAVDEWVEKPEKIDLILVIGTSAQVYPAAGYIGIAREKGARVAVVNIDRADTGLGGLVAGDWFFQGDAGVLVPEILRSVIGDISSMESQ